MSIVFVFMDEAPYGRYASRARTQNCLPRIAKPASVRLLHLDVVEASVKQQVRIRAVHS